MHDWVCAAAAACLLSLRAKDDVKQRGADAIRCGVIGVMVVHVPCPQPALELATACHVRQKIAKSSGGAALKAALREQTSCPALAHLCIR